jgi:hypothetical protein
MHLELHQTLQHAVDKGIEAYITSRRARIPIFIAQHFSFRGALALHRKTFGRDVYKYPVNLGFTPPFGDVGRDLVYLAPLYRGDTHCYTVSASHAGMPPPPCLPCTCRTTASESREMPGVMPLSGAPRPQGPCPDTNA